MKDNRRKEIKPKNHLTTPDPTEINPLGVERVTEKLSIPIPVQPLLRPTGITIYIGQRVRILLRDGNVIVGTVQKRLFNYLHLVNVEETGRDFKLTADWCDVDLGTIARVYPATAKVEQISKP
jgi:hypothetical protein